MSYRHWYISSCCRVADLLMRIDFVVSGLGRVSPYSARSGKSPQESLAFARNCLAFLFTKTTSQRMSPTCHLQTLASCCCGRCFVLGFCSRRQLRERVQVLLLNCITQSFWRSLTSCEVLAMLNGRKWDESSEWISSKLCNRITNLIGILAQQIIRLQSKFLVDQTTKRWFLFATFDLWPVNLSLTLLSTPSLLVLRILVCRERVCAEERKTQT